MKTPFVPKMKLSDLLLTNHNLILMLPRFGIELGFGEKSIDEVCKQYHVSTSLFLMICNVYTYSDYVPEEQDLNRENMQELLPYLSASHSYYLTERLSHIENHLNKIAEACTPKPRTAILKFFQDYKNEVINHFDYEEKVVFPYINFLLNGVFSKNYSILQFKETHSNIEDKLMDLINIIIKYLPHDLLPKERISVIFDIFQLSNDLKTHALIEEKIIIPYVISLEKSKNQ